MILKIVSLAFVVMLSGCAVGPHLDVLNVAMNAGVDRLPDPMRQRNLVATVGVDEQHGSAYDFDSQVALWLQGVQPKTPEYGYRYVRVGTRQTTRAVYYAPGMFLILSATMVPDHIPRLKKGDVVEIRMEAGRYTLKDFSKTGTGNIIVRVLCRKDDPDYMPCGYALPKIGKYPAGGPTGTPYPASARDYGFTFTPAYDDAGKPIREIPEYVKGTLPRHEFFGKPAVSQAN